MENNSATSMPNDESGRRVSDSPGPRRRLPDPPDPLDDPGDVSSSTRPSYSRTGFHHAAAVGISSPESDPEVDFPKLKHGAEGRTACRELCNLDETTPLAGAQVNSQASYSDRHGRETVQGHSSNGEYPRYDMWPAHLLSLIHI